MLLQRPALSQQVGRVVYALLSQILTYLEAAALLVWAVQQLRMEEGVDAAITVEVEVGIRPAAAAGLHMQVASSLQTRRAFRVATAT